METYNIEELDDLKKKIKHLGTPGIIFEKLGINYLGPVDGHDLRELTKTLREAKAMKGPKLVHILTTKGKGYDEAEKDATKFHGVSPFHKVNGQNKKLGCGQTFSQAFSSALIELARQDDQICAITAAMTDGTGLADFAKQFPDRFFDVGIAEQHAVTFAAGLAKQGKKPVLAIYSTFLQRAYDQIIHDVCLQKLPVVFAIDRAGLVGADGPTHHGSFDLSFMRLVPNLVVSAARNDQELRSLLYSAFKSGLPFSIRYPRGSVPDELPSNGMEEILPGQSKVLLRGSDVIFLGIGASANMCCEAGKILAQEGIKAQVIDARFVKPLDEEIVQKANEVGKVIVVEENTFIGGLYSALAEKLVGRPVQVRSIALPDSFVCHGNADELRHDCKLSIENICLTAKELLK